MATLSTSQTALLRAKWHAAFDHLDVKAARLSCAFKAGFDPNQPRVPAGDPDGGQWTGRGGNGGGGKPKPTRRKPKKPGKRPKLNVPVPRTPIRDKSPLEPPPKIPRRRPATKQEINAISKAMAKWIARAAGRRLLGPASLLLDAIEAVDCIDDHLPSIQSYFDEPKTLEELQKAAKEPSPGYDIHHIVEKTPARSAGFPESMIDGPANLVRIPRLKHWQINGWYGAKNDDFFVDGRRLSPREYLRDKEWNERARVGHEALRRHGVLKP